MSENSQPPLEQVGPPPVPDREKILSRYFKKDSTGEQPKPVWFSRPARMDCKVSSNWFGIRLRETEHKVVSAADMKDIHKVVIADMKDIQLTDTSVPSHPFRFCSKSGAFSL
ncbi:hypothetical protein COLO4_13553 [Corchorus olitorius]|uniref:Uncharacterized protein n=1 Tax=Corchorus olitorius TaxID=93759 RepID=A0A1R3JVX6_9ROSI|nr:hypothetical protein COLO4_13553 [Corchorus olitorius]